MNQRVPLTAPALVYSMLSLILIDSSLILRAILLIVSAVCCTSTDGVMPAVVSVVEVFPLTLLALAVLVSSEG